MSEGTDDANVGQVEVKLFGMSSGAHADRRVSGGFGESGGAGGETFPVSPDPSQSPRFP